MNIRQHRQHGCLLGLAIGDALGAAVEFRTPGSFEPVTGYRAGGPHGLDAGEWTDDTSMTLALVDSIASAGWDLNDQISRYVAWWRRGEYSVNSRCFDIGIATRTALANFERHGDARTSGARNQTAASADRRSRRRQIPRPEAARDPRQRPRRPQSRRGAMGLSRRRRLLRRGPEGGQPRRRRQFYLGRMRPCCFRNVSDRGVGPESSSPDRRTRCGFAGTNGSVLQRSRSPNCRR